MPLFVHSWMVCVKFIYMVLFSFSSVQWVIWLNFPYYGKFHVYTCVCCVWNTWTLLDHKVFSTDKSGLYIVWFNAQNHSLIISRQFFSAAFNLSSHHSMMLWIAKGVMLWNVGPMEEYIASHLHHPTVGGPGRDFQSRRPFYAWWCRPTHGGGGHRARVLTTQPFLIQLITTSNMGPYSL